MVFFDPTVSALESPSDSSGLSSSFALPPAETASLLLQVSADLGRRYEVRSYLGEGAFATVWEARDQATGEAIAVKRFKALRGVGSKFYRELSTLFRFQHPRIVRVINLKEAEEGARYLFLEFCEGGTLRATVNRGRKAGIRCSPDRARVIARQLAEGLAAAHQQGIAHRDIKPENVLFARRSEQPYGGAADIKLADFGLARALATVAPDTDGALRALSGSPAYMAPEQFEGTFAAASDLYALGVVLYELLHGQLPFTGTPEQLAYQHLRGSPELRRDLPAPWPRLLAALLDKNLTRRITAPALVEELRDLPVRPPSASKAPVAWSVPRSECASAVNLFGRTEEGRDELLVVSPERLVRFEMTNGKRCGDMLLPPVDRAFQDSKGALWFLRAGDVLHLDDQHGPQTRLSANGTVEALAPPSRGAPDRVALIRGDELSEWRVAGQPSSECLWRTCVRNSGLRPSLLRIDDGRLIVAEGPINPRLTVYGPTGKAVTSIPLPGLCWYLAGWNEGPVVYTKLLVGGSFAVCRVDVEHGTVTVLPAPSDLTLVAAAPNEPGTVYGLRSEGSVLAWRATDVVEPVVRFNLDGATARCLVTDGRCFAVLGRKSDGSSVQVRSIDAGMSGKANSW